MGYLGSMPLVSDIIPVYNVEKYLACCLDSIVGQTYRNLEIILVNDGTLTGAGKFVSSMRIMIPEPACLHRKM